MSKKNRFSIKNEEVWKVKFFIDHEIEFERKRGKSLREARTLRNKKETIIIEKLLQEIQERRETTSYIGVIY